MIKQGDNLSLKVVLMSGILCLLSACASQQTPRQALDYEKSDKDYHALKQTIINQVAEPETFDRILHVYTLSSYYELQDDSEKAGMLLSEQYMESGEYVRCMEVAKHMLSKNYTSLTAHFAMSECAARASDAEHAQPSSQHSDYSQVARFHTYVLDSYIEAIWRTGDGSSPQSAFVINSSNDLYAFVRLHDLVAVGQDISYFAGMPIQEIRILRPENNRQFNWYFNVTPQYRKAAIDEYERP